MRKYLFQSAEFLPSTAVESKKQIFGVVAYANVLSTGGDYFSRETLEKLATQFMLDFIRGEAKIDIQHENNPVDAFPYVSFVTGDDPEDGLPPNAWMLGMQILDDKIWKQVMAGELCSFSMECVGYWEEKEITVEVPQIITGITEPALDDGHTHFYILQINPETGLIIGGVTSTEQDHFHKISYFSRTEQANAHNHRYFTSF